MERARRIQIVRESITKITKILTDGKVQVTQAGVKAFVNYDEKTMKPMRVNLPMLPDDASDELIDAVQGFLDSEVSKVLYADSRSALRSKYEDLEGIYKPVESLFCEGQMTRAFPGSRHNLAKMHQAFVDRFVEPKLKEAIFNGASEQELFQVLAIPALRAWGGQPFFMDYMRDKWHLIAGIQKELDPIAKKMSSMTKPEDCYDMAKQIRNAVMGEPTGGEGHNPFGDKSEEGKGTPNPGAGGAGSSKNAKDSSKGGGANGGPDEGSDESEPEEEDASDESEDEDGGSAGASEEPADEPEDGVQPAGISNPDSLSDQKDSKLLDKDEEVTQEERGGASFLTGMDFDKVQDISTEFGQYVTDLCSTEMDDQSYTVFTREWDKCRVPKIPSSYNPSWITEMEADISGMVGPVARNLERAFAARNKSLWQQGQTRGKMASQSLYKLSAGDDRIFKTRIDHKTREIVVSLVVDCSGSMGGAKIHTAMCSAWVMSEVLQKLGIKHEIIGFTTAWLEGAADNALYDEMRNSTRDFDRYEPLHFPMFKGFDERFNIEVKKRVSSFARVSGIMASNIDGESIQFAYERLSKEALRGKPKGRMMIVFSDGMPAGSVESRKLNAHLKHVVKRIEADGVNIVGVGIQSDSVSHFYRKNVKIDNISELPGAVLTQLRDALLSA